MRHLSGQQFIFFATPSRLGKDCPSYRADFLSSYAVDLVPHAVKDDDRALCVLAGSHLSSSLSCSPASKSKSSSRSMLRISPSRAPEMNYLGGEREVGYLGRRPRGANCGGRNLSATCRSLPATFKASERAGPFGKLRAYRSAVSAAASAVSKSCVRSFNSGPYSNLALDSKSDS
jgi:hypothetical protein